MLNLVVLIGILEQILKLKRTPSGIKVAKMRLAVNDIWTNRSTGEKEKKDALGGSQRLGIGRLKPPNVT